MTSSPIISELRRIVRDCPHAINAIARASGVDRANLWRFSVGQSGLSSQSLDRLASCLGLRLMIDETFEQTEREL